MKYCILDWTFCVIHTFCAIQSWWRFRRPGEDFPTPWWEHVEVQSTFRKRMGDMLKEFTKKYDPSKFYICQDCPRQNIWRLQLDSNYKANRSETKISKEGHDVWGRVFQEAMEILNESSLNHTVIRVERAEADDCVAVVCDHLLATNTSEESVAIDVVTGDSDLYQLETKPGVTVWDRKGNRWRSRLKEIEPNHYIQAKCYAGDKSDGIPSVGVRIGMKTALNWITGIKPMPKDSSKIDKKRLEINQKLILFRHIPEEIRSEILETLS